ncbi:MAG: RluA family pseudouridine synthase [Prevotella sp.]|nr:RluA family pseudouridine synthase [Prevotella sp.]
MTRLHALTTDIRPPKRFTYPFCYEPHPLCQLAAGEVQAYIASHPAIKEDADRGKMFGVLVVECAHGLAYLAAYSGLLAGRNDWEFFVPPVYDAQQPDGYFKTKEREISLTTHHSPVASKQMSQQLQEWLFHQYRLLNARGEVKDLVDIWQDYYDRPKLRNKYPLPPGGTGDCCAPKLLQYAYQHQLKPVCMAEFWWGQPTKEEIRQHLNYYPACRGKCLPILTWMLQGLEVDPDPALSGLPKQEIPIVYEDEWLIVVDKPSGMLSVPGRISEYSVETVMRQRYPDAIVCHRLDMGTSGLLIVAKSQEAYQPLQQQFIKHQVKKKYLALLETNHSSFLISHSSFPTKGRISLPLRPDPMNRPRQVVDMEHGKRAVTDYEFIHAQFSIHNSQFHLVALYPQTGRTHQLRIHCAHPDGLGRPIVGDELYGIKGERLCLHAAEIWFTHPVTGEQMHLVSPPPFLPPEAT